MGQIGPFTGLSVSTLNKILAEIEYDFPDIKRTDVTIIPKCEGGGIPAQYISFKSEEGPGKGSEEKYEDDGPRH